MKRDRLYFSFLCLCCFLFCALDVQAQQDYWKGQVKDAVSGEPMIGVSVRVKGTGSGTITDFDGNFTVKASKGDILVISYVGYKTLELDLKNKTTLGVISLGEDTETLEEVVVVGYGVQKKVSSVGSIATAKGDDLLKIGSVNSVSEALQGQMPGVVAINSTSKPGADKASLLIRGKSTWGEAEPLVLVDGIERDFNDVDVNEIESISVLKDASATAVYGVKGANGVILLTTKRGLEQKPEISFTANFGFKQPSAAPEWSDYVTSMKQYNRAQANDGNWGAMVPESTITAWENAYATGNYGPYNDVFPEVDWWKELVKNVGYEQAYNLNVRGGTKKMSYFVSLGYCMTEIFLILPNKRISILPSLTVVITGVVISTSISQVLLNFRSMWPVRWVIRTNRLIMRMSILRMNVFLKRSLRLQVMNFRLNIVMEYGETG